MNIKTLLVGILIGIAVSLLVYYVCHQYNNTKIENTSTTIIKTVHDTIPVFVDSPLPRDSVVIRYITVSVPVYDTIKVVAESVQNDSVTISLPITQKAYKDSTYEAWVSGYRPSLDSIRIFQPIHTITNTITNTEVKYKTKRWGVGIQAGLGFTTNMIQPYIGIGVSYNIFSW